MPISNGSSTPDPDPAQEWSRPDDRFVPIRAGELIDALVGDAASFGAEASALREVASAMQTIIEQEAQAFERLLGDTYAAFNPDRDTIPQQDPGEARTPEGYAELDRLLIHLFDKANFERLTDAQVTATVQAANTHRLRVKLEPNRVQNVMLLIRGRSSVVRARRSWRSPIRGETSEIPIYRRLAIVVRLKDEPCVMLKLFKEIPVSDVQALLPHAEVAMSWFDRLLLLGGGAGTIGTTAIKLLTTAGTAVAFGRLLWVLLAGLGTLVFKTVMGYRRARRNSDSQRTRQLYYQNLNNNAGVISSLISMTAQEELKEAVLAYALGLADAATQEPTVSSVAAIRAKVQTYVRRRFEADIDFDAADAQETLARMGLWIDHSRWRVMPPPAALKRLRRYALSRDTQDYHERTAQDPDRESESTQDVVS